MSQRKINTLNLKIRKKFKCQQIKQVIFCRGCIPWNEGMNPYTNSGSQFATNGCQQTHESVLSRPAKSKPMASADSNDAMFSTLASEAKASCNAKERCCRKKSTSWSRSITVTVAGRHKHSAWAFSHLQKSHVFKVGWTRHRHAPHASLWRLAAAVSRLQW